MIPEIGHFALILALCVAVVQGSLPIYGAAVGDRLQLVLERGERKLELGLTLSEAPRDQP